MIDILFWAWVIATILLFIDFIIPHPLWIISKPITITLFFVLLFSLIIRMIIRGAQDLIKTATHPALLAFIGTLALLLIYKKIRDSQNKTRKKK